MPSGLYYEGTTFAVPHHVVNERIEQLKQIIPQFFILQSLFSSGRYLPYRWAFYCSKEMVKSNIVIFRIELLDMKTEDRIHRNWEVKGNTLVSDTKNSDKEPFSLSGALYIGWWQSLIGEGIVHQNNVILARALEIGLRESPQKYLRMTVTSGSIRIRSLMGKTVQGIDFELYVEFADDKRKPRTLKWTLDCNKDLKDGTLVQTEPESVTFLESSPNFKHEKEKMIMSIREQLIEDGKHVKGGDWIVDQYYVSSLILSKKGYKAVISIVFMSQMGNTKLFEVTAERSGFEYIIHKCEPLNFDFSIIDFIEEKGDKFNLWQHFSKKSCVIYNPCIKKLAEIGANSQSGCKVIESTRVQCRVRRSLEHTETEADFETGSFTGFYYILIVRVKEPSGIVTTQEWKLSGNPCGEEDYKLLSSRKFKPNRSVTPSVDMTQIKLTETSPRSPSPFSTRMDTNVLVPMNRTPPPQRPTHRRTETVRRSTHENERTPVIERPKRNKGPPPNMREYLRDGQMEKTFQDFAIDKEVKIMELGKIRSFLQSPRK